MWLGSGWRHDAQKLLFQPILRCSDFYVIDLNELTQYGKQDFEQKQRKLVKACNCVWVGRDSGAGVDRGRNATST